MNGPKDNGFTNLESFQKKMLKLKMMIQICLLLRRKIDWRKFCSVKMMKVLIMEKHQSKVRQQTKKHSYFKNARSKENADFIDEILNRFALNEFAHRQVSELPGGVRKLLDIAMALVRKPDILLLDEPTSGVGAEEKYPLMDTIAKALSCQGLTVIFVEHDMDIVQNYSDRIIAFYQGAVIADGNGNTVLNDSNVKKYEPYYYLLDN